jgi:hypothetical protein
MPLPSRGHPVWGIAALVVICTTLATCLNVVYASGFVLDKDGLTIGATAFSGVVMLILRHVFGAKE